MSIGMLHDLLQKIKSGFCGRRGVPSRENYFFATVPDVAQGWAITQHYLGSWAV